LFASSSFQVSFDDLFLEDFWRLTF
jgi:hypothetical protein